MTTPSMPLLPVEYPEPVVAQMLRRAGSRGYDAWWHRVQWSGFCATPIHLAEVDAYGRERVVLGRCNNRRASVCPSCSDLYAGDTWQLIHAGIDGGHHELPATIAEHPMVFATLTAPGFGAVHTTHPGGTGPGRRCHPDREYRRCPHGRPRWCTTIHHGDDPVLGQPLCGDCYDYRAHVLFAWHAPELWRRFTITLRRLLRRHLRAIGEPTDRVRVSFVKVVELQRRGVPHFHAVIRLDAATDPDQPPAAPDTAVTAGELAQLVHLASSRARLEIPATDGGGNPRHVVFGEQTNTQTLTPAPSAVPGSDATSTADAGPPPSAGVRAGRRIAAYLAKYVTKSVSEFGLSPRRMSPAAIARLDVSDHIRAILNTIMDFAAHPDYADMQRWLHTLGYRGHITTKSRRFSTTMGHLRARRAAWRTQQAQDTRSKSDGLQPSPASADNHDDNGDSATTLARSVGWEYVRSGHVSEGDRILTVTAALHAREARRVARDMLAELAHHRPSERGESGIEP